MRPTIQGAMQASSQRQDLISHDRFRYRPHPPGRPGPCPDRHPGRAAARREYRHVRPRHGEFRPLRDAPRCPARRLAERRRPQEGRDRGGLRRDAYPGERPALRQRGRGHRRSEPCPGDDRPRAWPDEARADPGRGDAGGRRPHRLRRARRHPVRARAHRPDQRRDQSRRCDPDLPGQSRLRLAEPRPGRPAQRL